MVTPLSRIAILVTMTALLALAAPVASAVTLSPGDPTLYHSDGSTPIGGGPGDPFDTEMLMLQLVSVQPIVIHQGGATFSAPSFFDVFVVDVLAPGRATVDSFFDIFYEIELSPGVVQHSFFDVFFDITVVLDPATGQKSIVFDDISFGADLAGGDIRLRESPSRPSQGKGSGKRLASGDVVADSFFDIFTEISLDGGINWAPSVDPTHLRLTGVPEPASLGGLVFGLLLLGLGRRAAAGRPGR